MAFTEYAFWYIHKAAAQFQKGYSEILDGIEVLAVDNWVYRDII